MQATQGLLACTRLFVSVALHGESKRRLGLTAHKLHMEKHNSLSLLICSSLHCTNTQKHNVQSEYTRQIFMRKYSEQRKIVR